MQQLKNDDEGLGKKEWSKTTTPQSTECWFNDLNVESKNIA